jgi:hypothetical protein
VVQALRWSHGHDGVVVLSEPCGPIKKIMRDPAMRAAVEVQKREFREIHRRNARKNLRVVGAEGR